ncbi:MAG: two-component system response regulator [Methylophilaceae bacterium]
MTCILIVDDKQDNLYYLETLLTSSGYTVKTALNGVEALSEARQNPPQLIISDLLMPNMDGYTLLRKWKADASLNTIPFIVYTATYTEPEDKNLALNLGADAFILKPSEPTEFITIVREVLSNQAVSLPNNAGSTDEKDLKEYNSILIRKLEEKTLQLESANRVLSEENTKLKAAEKRIQHLAYFDLLTNLPNRRFLMDRLQQSLAANARLKSNGALLYIDLDNFKTLNDTRGHSVGDILLAEVAKRLRTCLRDGDTLARIGGDEFVVILENLDNDISKAAIIAESVCSKIIASLEPSFLLDGYIYHSSTSIGVAMFSNIAFTIDELLQRADIAMYQAKAAGRNTSRFYDPEMQSSLEERSLLERDLRIAISKDQLKIHYQVQVDDLGKYHGVEALLRWQHPDKGLIFPKQFIPLAEDTGLILPIGKWVMDTACAQIKKWENDTTTKNLQIAVNVSACQFHEPNFVEEVSEIISRYAINPSLLKLELTESLVLDHIEEAILKMHALKEIGVSFSMDDFGTGFSSLSYLTKLPLDQLKIDQSFVRNICSDPRDAVVVQTIIGMANNLGIDVIAEGVELKEQQMLLAKYKCKFYQGYLFGKPIPIEELEKTLNSN